ncbi:hypothetical protein MFMK1_003173 [Metallumcola ferriviriculae]|uniref:Uncharacterized protein n=1 Tax=Metallumcola ferriviriculae TaxID=3039180 RepID=A0AAU0USU1_9FIRM|nr:hypothetical protein MFMK1_003173 [Desulfitibacteraceae bacterium MK1]
MLTARVIRSETVDDREIIHYEVDCPCCGQTKLFIVADHNSQSQLHCPNCGVFFYPTSFEKASTNKYRYRR